MAAVALPRTVSLWLPVVAWAALIFALSSVPNLTTHLGLWDLALRKFAHLTEYAILGALLLRAVRTPGWAFSIAVLYAASDELHQHFVSGRHAAPLDVAIDAVGIAAGVLAAERIRG
jgi:VanZ family protein